MMYNINNFIEIVASCRWTCSLLDGPNVKRDWLTIPVQSSSWLQMTFCHTMQKHFNLSLMIAIFFSFSYSTNHWVYTCYRKIAKSQLTFSSGIKSSSKCGFWLVDECGHRYIQCQCKDGNRSIYFARQANGANGLNVKAMSNSTSANDAILLIRVFVLQIMPDAESFAQYFFFLCNTSRILASLLVWMHLKSAVPQRFVFVHFFFRSNCSMTHIYIQVPILIFFGIVNVPVHWLKSNLMSKTINKT